MKGQVGFKVMGSFWRESRDPSDEKWKVKQLEEVDVVEKRIVSAKEYAAVPKETKFSESDIKSSSDEETDDL